MTNRIPMSNHEILRQIAESWNGSLLERSPDTYEAALKQAEAIVLMMRQNNPGHNFELHFTTLMLLLHACMLSLDDVDSTLNQSKK